MKIVLAGGSGQVGTILARYFHARGDSVVVLTRHARHEAPWKLAEWDGKTLGAWASEVDGADVVINLAGKTINCRYTAENRREIVATRLDSTHIIGKAIDSVIRKPAVWLNASAAGVYRHSLDNLYDETTTDLGGTDDPVPETWQFAELVCRQWEDAFFRCETPGTRKIALRTTLVLSPDEGGVFTLLLRLVHLGLGGRQGNGKQSVSWMTDQDYVRAIELLIDSEQISGPVNLCVPEPVSNAALMQGLREAAGVKPGIPAEAWMIKAGAIFLRTEPWLVLKSVRVVPKVLQDAGFDFLHPDWPSAARNLVRRWKKNNHKN